NYNNFTENLNNISNFIEKLPFEEQTRSIKKVYSSQDTKIFYENGNLEQIDDQRIETNNTQDTEIFYENENIEQLNNQRIINDTNEDKLTNLISKILTRCNNYPKINLFSGDVTENYKKQTNNDTLAFNNLLNDMLSRIISESKSKNNPIVQYLQNYPADLNRIDENDKSIYSLKETKCVENNQIENLEKSSAKNEILRTEITNFARLNDKSNCQFEKTKNFSEINDNSIENVKYRAYIQGNIKFQCDKNNEVQNQLNNFNQLNILNPSNIFG
ncbi:hypothetical protein DMUE_6146, partial [Dictyocoela muelleri]